MATRPGGARTRDIDLIVNATSLGMTLAIRHRVPARLLAPHHIVFDWRVIAHRKLRCFVARQMKRRARREWFVYVAASRRLSFSALVNREAPIEAMRSGDWRCDC